MVGLLEHVAGILAASETKCAAGKENDQEYADHDHVLSDGDEAALIPPVSGGFLAVEVRGHTRD